MDKLPVLLPGGVLEKTTMQALEKMNRRVEGYGLVLKPEEMRYLAQRQGEVLQNTGRIEFGEGILPKLLFAFGDSPHIPPTEFAATLDELMGYFYHFKGESMEQCSDDELVAFMKQHFDGDCHGSLEYLSGTLLEHLATAARTGAQPEEDDTEDDADDEEEEE